jgi:hypothetical protein
VLGERSALRVSKLGLRGLEGPFACAPFDGADVYLNAFRGVFADQRLLLGRHEFGRHVLSDCANCEELRAAKVNSERVSMESSLLQMQNARIVAVDSFDGAVAGWSRLLRGGEEHVEQWA